MSGQKKFWSSRLFKVVVVSACAILLMAANPRGIFAPVQLVFRKISSPFQKIFYLGGLKISDTRQFLASIGSLKSENADLALENQRLLAQSARVADLEQENRDLREQLKLMPRDKFDLSAAFVIGRDPQGNWLEISRGQNDGIAKDMPVIVSDGILIGRIGEVYWDSAQVVLLTNAKSSINVVDQSTEAKGVAFGEYGLGIVMDMVLQTDALNAGDRIATAGSGSAMPSGLLVGNVAEIRNSPDGLFQRAILTQPVKSSELRTVFIIR